MAIQKKKQEEKKQEEKKQEEKHEIKVTRAHELEKCIMFDMVVNGITIYGCNYKELEKKDGSGSFVKIGFPSKKGKDDKYYNEVYFPVSEDDIATIEKQIEALI